ncbi:MAG: nitroreductase family protein [Oscillospiraceae bacterium]|nr:nitroreductase family protein [Oscillospiraceae bacterium]
MDIFDVISNRHSYRGKYKPDPVLREDLVKILKAGLDAPSGCNKQTTSFIAIDDKELLKRVLEVIEPPVAESAPAAICVLTQRINAYRDKCFAVQDYSAAIENMLLAIKALGYESCWYEGHITDDDRLGDAMARVLGVSDDYELVCLLPVGTAAENVKPPQKRSFEERAWFNGFKN